MKAIVCEKYGPPDVLRIDDLPTPTPADDEIRVRVRATSVTVADVRTRAFRVPPMYWLPGRLALGITGPRNAVLGAELAGEVDAVGKAVTRFAVGDEVIALMAHDMGGYAQYKCLPEDAVIAKKPANLSFEEAAVVPVGGLTAFTFLHVGGIQPGQHILIYGASGSVGTYAVQLAKYFGAEVTGVCSGRNIDLVRSLGADHVIDYTVQDFTQIGDTYDIVFDAHGSTTFAQVKPILKPIGVYLHSVMVGSEIKAPWFTMTTGIKVVGGTPEKPPNAFEDLVDLIESKRLHPVLDRCYPMKDIVEAHRYVDSGRKRGNVAITID